MFLNTYDNGSKITEKEGNNLEILRQFNLLYH